MGFCMSDSPWSEKVPKLQTAWDSVSMTRLLTCPRKYQLSQIEGWQPKKASVFLEFGILLHKCLERFHTLRAKGMDIDKALHETVKYTFILSKDFEGDGDGGVACVVRRRRHMPRRAK